MHQQNVSQEITRHKREINKKIESGEVKASEFGEVTSNMERNNGLKSAFLERMLMEYVELKKRSDSWLQI